MVRVIILVEGQTEERFVKDILTAHFQQFEIFLTPIIFYTSKDKNKKYIGGVTIYEKIKNQIKIAYKTDQSAYVTTMIDFYRRPKPFPGETETSNIEDSFEKAQEMEKYFQQDINWWKFIANFIIHEFEALLFTDPKSFNLFLSETAINDLQNIKSQFKTPEHINDNPDTAPSKQIKRLGPRYQKISYGIEIAKIIGLASIRSACKHFDQWISNLESLR